MRSNQLNRESCQKLLLHICLDLQYFPHLQYGSDRMLMDRKPTTMIFERLTGLFKQEEKAKLKSLSSVERSPVEVRQDLLNEYKLWKDAADSYTNLGLSDSAEMYRRLARLQSVENRIIETTDDIFKKEYLRLYINYSFNLIEILEAEIEGDWSLPFQEAIRYLAEHMPVVTNIEGSQLLIWLFDRVNQEKQSGKNLGAILLELKNHCISTQTFCEIPIADTGITGDDLYRFFDFDMLTLLMGSKISKTFHFFCDLILQVGGGFEWIEQVLVDGNESVVAPGLEPGTSRM